MTIVLQLPPWKARQPFPTYARSAEGQLREKLISRAMQLGGRYDPRISYSDSHAFVEIVPPVISEAPERIARGMAAWKPPAKKALWYAQRDSTWCEALMQAIKEAEQIWRDYGVTPPPPLT